MLHHNKTKKLGRTRKVRTALMRSLARALILEERIETTEAKAKSLRPFVEPLITKSKVDSVANRRHVNSELGNQDDVVKKLFELVGPRYKEREGGYTRIVRLRERKGDGAVVTQISLV